MTRWTDDRLGPAERDDWCGLFDVGDCWEWKRAKNAGGYGQVFKGPRGASRVHYVHRLVYEILVGPIPDGWVIDHLCRNTSCANPDHLQPVTPAENVRRGISPDRTRRRYCSRGHDTWATGRYSNNNCRVCAIESATDWNRRNRVVPTRTA